MRKAREGAGLSLEAAAQAAGTDPSILHGLEESGRIPDGIDLPKLAGILDLNPGKLGRLAGGWHPAKTDLSRWRELRQVTTSEGISVHAYLVWDEVSREAALFDTGWSAAPALQLVTEEGLQLRHLFITHTHQDHIAGMEEVRRIFPKIHLHTSAKSAPPQHRNRANDFIHLGSLRITNRDTPGHAEDGVSYVIGNWPEDAPHVVVAGDAIFAGSIGGARQAMGLARQKVRDQIFSLPGDTLICPGHGPMSTVAEEKSSNPFF